MSTFEQLNICKPATLEAFKAAVMGLRYAFVAEIPTDTGRVMLVRAGDDHGPVIGYREDYLGNPPLYYVRN